MKQPGTTAHKERSILLAAATLCLLALVGMTLALTLGQKQAQAPFVPPPFDSAACSGTPAVPKDLDWQELDAEVFRVSICGVVRPVGNSAEVWLTNPESNSIWLKLRVLDQNGVILGETGLIKPGEYIQSVVLKEQPISGASIALKIMAYEPDTYLSAGAIFLNTVFS